MSPAVRTALPEGLRLPALPAQSRMISRMMMMIRVPIPMYMRDYLPLAL
jgi:hypothetical protein